MNEIGRRIGYDVENGLYTGKKNDIGFDGIWKIGDEWIVVEVKTTDAYRINLDTVMKYAQKLEKKLEDEIKLSSLIVAGRQDILQLERCLSGDNHLCTSRGMFAEVLMTRNYLQITKSVLLISTGCATLILLIIGLTYAFYDVRESDLRDIKIIIIISSCVVYFLMLRTICFWCGGIITRKNTGKKTLFMYERRCTKCGKKSWRFIKSGGGNSGGNGG